MTFEQAAALKILFGTEEVQVIEDGEKDPPDGKCEECGQDTYESPDPPGITVKRHGIVNHDYPIWEVGEAVKLLAEQFE